MNKGLLDLFENIKNQFLVLSLEEFTAKINNENHKFEFYSAVSGSPLASDYHKIQDYKNTAANTNFPGTLREDAYQKLKYIVDEVIAKIKSGITEVSKKRISEEIVNQVSVQKIKKLCLEINATPDENVLSLMQSFGDCLKWTLWYRAKQVGTKLKESTGFESLLNESIKTPYYTDNATNRFLKDFINNSQKTGYDMVRHSENYIPDVVVINPAIDALEHILKITFSSTA